MSDSIKHECGIALIRLLKPLEYYKATYGTAFYGIDKMYLMMEKQHNRGQDGAGFASIKFGTNPGERYMSRMRSKESQSIKDVFSKIYESINAVLSENPHYKDDVEAMNHYVPFVGNLFLGHVRYGTSGLNSIESVHPFLRQNNWMHRNLIIAGNFNMTNLNEQFDNLLRLGQHPKEKVDTVTVMEKIGHFLDAAVLKLYKEIKEEGFSKQEASSLIVDRLNISKILKKASKDWDGGYAMAGLLGHGDAFVLRDPAGIRPTFYYTDEEVAVVASERPAIQTVFNVDISSVKELDPGSAIIIRKNGDIGIKQIQEPLDRKACSFERIYFSRGSDFDIYKERKKLGELLVPKVLEEIGNDVEHTVFSYIPNTAEIAFLGMVREVENVLNTQKVNHILSAKQPLTKLELEKLISISPRVEKVAIKDAKLRTFITEDASRNDLVAHVYDITYGSVCAEDNLVIIDDSIVRGTTLKRSILKMLSRLKPKRIVVVSSAPQIRYPDCYGIDMARLGDFIAFKAALELHKDQGTYQNVLDSTYAKCKEQEHLESQKVVNAVKSIYDPFKPEDISKKMSEMLSEGLGVEVSILFQSIENLHLACPDNKGDWYFTGDYPTPGGNKVANKAFINFYEGVKDRAY